LWGEAAYATNSTGGTTWAYGTFAKNWVMSNPTLVSVDGVPGKHVNSIYLRYNSKNIIEIGWYRNYPVNSTTTQGFTVRSKNGSHEPVALGQMGDGQYAYFQINNLGTYSFETWINGVRMYTWTDCGFSYGTTRVGSERKHGGPNGDTNYANFQNLKYKASSGAWGYWYKINDEYLGLAEEDIYWDVYGNPDVYSYALYINRNSN